MKNDWKNIFFILFALLCFGFGWGQTITISNNRITQSGGSDSNRNTPQDIIDAGYGTLVAPKVIELGNYDLEIQGFYDDTGWKYIYQTGRRFRSTSTANWKSGVKLNNTYIAGATHVLDAPSTSFNDNSNIYLNGGIINWYGVVVDHEADPASSNARVRFSNLDSSSELVVSFKGISYLVNDVGSVALLNVSLQRREKTGINSVIMRVGTNFSSPDQLSLIASDGGANIFNSSGVQSAISISGLQAITSTNEMSFYHNRGSDRRYVLVNPFLDLSGILIYNNNEEVQVDVDVSIGLSGTEKEGYVFRAYANDGHYLGSYSATDANGDTSLLLEDVWHGSGNTAASYLAPTTIVDRTIVDLIGYKYGGNIIQLSTSDLGSNGAVKVLGLATIDTNISQTDKSIVDAYTEIETLDELYDRSSSWKVDNVADEYPAFDSQLISVTGTTLDLDSQDLVVDANASQAFDVDVANNTITIKASTLTAGNGAFTSITTAGNISVANGASIELGYQDSNGKNIFVDFNWGTSDTYHVNIVDLNDNTVIATHSNQSNNYSGTFVAPTPFGSGAKIQLLNTGDNSVFYEANFTDENALTFVRTSGSINDISTETTGASQHEALFLARKILQKTESMAAALDGTTPILADDTTTITEANSTIATKENQEAIRALRLRIMTKTSASYEALKGAE